jgi:hypothetical protein
VSEYIIYIFYIIFLAYIQHNADVSHKKTTDVSYPTPKYQAIKIFYSGAEIKFCQFQISDRFQTASFKIPLYFFPTETF